MSGFWAGRRVLVTGHTGFKGAWLAFWLAEMGAEVSGLALAPSGEPSLHDILDIASRGRFVQADINDRAALDALFAAARPEVVIHMAAQALVRPSYEAPVESFATNTLGTVSLLDAVRRCAEVRAVVVVTTDKVYENREWPWGYRETDALGGHDPYSASKGCAEIATASMQRSFFGPGRHPARIATVRAGNVVGGGDWSVDRLVPDIVRGCLGEVGLVRLRNPGAVRPWQHVLEPLHAYLTIAERLCTAPEGIDQAWNIGPDAAENRPVLEVAEAMVAALGRGRIELEPQADAPHEAHLLTLDCARARAVIGWRPKLGFADCVEMTASWYAAWARGEDMRAVTRAQLARIAA
ncbi:CDP-glucose 4,6-dehydratase [Roseococcus sp. SYP-B2431]|uniref:CDP-glucose 4,6-dehydratase n=1 Tax=Roseococcus sp. SYP-B2431 TaxID=2496640 RepID=UPI001038C03A|nr:CDP-glucose 4,6-dehydratase [Roseococcus sp. SYP-B2431]TCI00424.1 CDP-glucose 4,6-dehydratase [Roseococcus sp. SYP-B2431]